MERDGGRESGSSAAASFRAVRMEREREERETEKRMWISREMEATSFCRPVVTIPKPVTFSFILLDTFGLCSPLFPLKICFTFLPVC